MRTDFIHEIYPVDLLADFAELIDRNDPAGYLEKLSHRGLDWLFEFQLPLLSVHVAALRQPFLSAEFSSLPIRVQILIAAVKGPGNTLADVENLYHLAVNENDVRAACACTGLAIQTIIEGGREFPRFSKWVERGDQILEHSTPDPLAYTFLLLFQCWAEFLGAGNLDRAYKLSQRVYRLSQQAKSPSLIILHSALAAHLYYWQADLATLEIFLTDVAPLLDSPGLSPFSLLHFQSSAALLKTLQGDPLTGKTMFLKLFSHPMFTMASTGMWLQIQGNYLYTIATLGDRNEAKRIGKAMREKSVPLYNYHAQSYLHFNLAIVELLCGHPHKALRHAIECRTFGELCASENVARMSALVIGQALMELDRNEAALDHFTNWIPAWEKARYYIIAALGCVETGYLHLHRGEVEDARISLAKAKKLVPKYERIPTLYRSHDYALALEQRLDVRDSIHCCSSADPPVVITTFGIFSVTLQNGETLTNQNWHGPKSQELLMAIIALGGNNIPVERLSTMLWPDADGDRAMNSFKVTLSRVRNTLAGEDKSLRKILDVRQKHITLSRSLCLIDAFAFESQLERATRPPLIPRTLQSALNLYTGNFLEFSSETWIIQNRERLLDKFINATTGLCDFFLQEGNVQATIPLLTRALLFDPLNETLYTRLMQAHLDIGNRAKALTVYRKACAILGKELDIRPGPGLTALYQQIHGSDTP